MRLVALYLRSRRVGPALALLGLIAAITALALWVSSGDLYLFGAILFAPPLAAAMVIAAGTCVPFGESEQTASYLLPTLRLSHLLALLAWAGCGLATAAMLWSPSEMTGLTTAGALVQPSAVGWWLVRNLVGFAGLGFLSARWLGSGRAWIIALIHGILTLTSPPHTLFGWPTRPASDQEALVIAVVLLIMGLAVVVPKGAREDRTDGTEV